MRKYKLTTGTLKVKWLRRKHISHVPAYGHVKYSDEWISYLGSVDEFTDLVNRGALVECYDEICKELSIGDFYWFKTEGEWFIGKFSIDRFIILSPGNNSYIFIEELEEVMTEKIEKSQVDFEYYENREVEGEEFTDTKYSDMFVSWSNDSQGVGRIIVSPKLRKQIEVDKELKENGLK